MEEDPRDIPLDHPRFLYLGTIIWSVLLLDSTPRLPTSIYIACPLIFEQFPHRDVHLQFQKWAKQYGPIYSLILGTKTLVVLSSANAVKDLLDKKSGIYSDRQEMYVGQTLCSGDLRMLMMVCFCPFLFQF